MAVVALGKKAAQTSQQPKHLEIVGAVEHVSTRHRCPRQTALAWSVQTTAEDDNFSTRFSLLGGVLLCCRLPPRCWLSPPVGPCWPLPAGCWALCAARWLLPLCRLGFSGVSLSLLSAFGPARVLLHFLSAAGVAKPPWLSVQFQASASHVRAPRYCGCSRFLFCVSLESGAPFSRSVPHFIDSFSLTPWTVRFFSRLRMVLARNLCVGAIVTVSGCELCALGVRKGCRQHTFRLQRSSPSFANEGLCHSDCDQDSDISFMNDTDEEIDTAEIEEEDWIEYMKRSTVQKRPWNG